MQKKPNTIKPSTRKCVIKAPLTSSRPVAPTPYLVLHQGEGKAIRITQDSFREMSLRVRNAATAREMTDRFLEAGNAFAEMQAFIHAIPSDSVRSSLLVAAMQRRIDKYSHLEEGGAQ